MVAMRCVWLASLLLATFPEGATAEQVVHVFHVTSGPGWKVAPAVSGDLVVWGLYPPRESGSYIPRDDIRGKDLSTGRRFLVTKGTAVVNSLNPIAISGRTVVWTDCRSCLSVNALPGYHHTRIYAKDLVTGRVFSVSAGGTDQESPAVDGNTVVWVESRFRGTAILGKTLSTGTEFAVAVGDSMKSSPAISHNTVVWADLHNGGWDIYGRTVPAGRSFIVARHRGRGNDLLDPRISGSTVLWTSRFYRRQIDSIEAKDLSTGKYVHIANVPQTGYSAENGPDKTISGAIVVWAQARGGVPGHKAETGIYGKSLTTGKVFAIAVCPCDQRGPTVSGQTVVWERSGPVDRIVGQNIYAATLRLTRD
jgi:hypothetical protein